MSTILQTNIEDFPNYILYSDGRVWSLQSQRFLKHILNGRGYLYVDLYKNKKRHARTIHSLLAEHFISPRKDLTSDHIAKGKKRLPIDHIDNNKLNNNLENLRWVTYSENSRNIKYRKPRCSNISET